MSKVFNGVDWEALEYQKNVLCGLISQGRDDVQDRFRPYLSVAELDALDGILHLLDHFQDCAAEELGEATVFGTLTENSNVD